MAGVTIRYDGDPSGALDASTRVQDSLGDLDDKLGNATDAGEDAGDAIGDSLGDVEEAAGDASEGIDDVAESSDEASLSVRAIGKAGKEAIEGDLTGALSAATGFLRNFGPIGVIAGGLAAGGIGLVTAGVDAAREKTEAAEKRVNDWAQSFIEAGTTILGAADVIGRAQEIMNDPDRRKEAEENARLWGVDIPTAVRAMAGDQAALNAVNEQTVALMKQEAELNDRLNAPGAHSREQDIEDLNARQDTVAALERIKQLNDDIAGGAAGFRTWSDILKDVVADAGSATEEVDEFGNVLLTLPDGKQVLINAESGIATENVSGFKGDLDGIPETVNTKITADVDVTAAEAALSALLSKPRNIKVGITDRSGRAIL